MSARATTGGAEGVPQPRAARSRPRAERTRADLMRDIGVEVAVLALTLMVLAGLAVLPARTWWTQRQSMAEARAQLAEAEAEVAELQAARDLLASDAEVERLARRDYDLVFPGEESYRIVPADGAGAPPATVAPGP